MLDERKEYADYITAPSNDNAPRFYPDCFAENASKKKFSKASASPKRPGNFQGVERAMTIIARYYLFDIYHYENAASKESQDKILDDVRTILKSWCGFLPEDIQLPEQTDNALKNWLEIYYRTYITEEKFSSNIDTWEDIKEKKARNFSLSIFFSPKDKHMNDSKAISYSRVIARAINEGPLKTYYLICQKDYAEFVTYTTGKANTVIKSITKDGATPAKYKDLVLKFIAAYLIEKNRTGNNFNVVNLTDFSHWIQQANTSDRMKKFFYKKQHLFEFTKLINGNTSKVCVCPEYLETYDFKIVTKEEFSSVPDDYVCFADDGFGKFLKIM